MGAKNYHIVLGRQFDLDQFDRDSEAKKCPRHAMSMLRHALGAQVHQPVGRSIAWPDRIWTKVFGTTPQQAALARSLAQELTDEDVIFATGEDVGYPLAFYLRNKPRRPKLVVEVHSPRSPRSRFALKVLNVAESVDLFVATTWAKIDFVRRYAGLPEDQIRSMHEVTDTGFFTPGPVSPDKARPIIGSCGLEQRDYITLATATADMDVDVRICAVSPNATAQKDSFPEIIPDNMVAKYYAWPDLVQLYRDSDVVAITMRPNLFQAGQTSIMEAMACQRPVITTEAEGMVADFASEGSVRAVPEQDAEALRAAIEDLLAHPDTAAELARRGRERVARDFNPESYVQRLAELLRSQAA
jgi:hypothetical protein